MKKYTYLFLLTLASAGVFAQNYAGQIKVESSFAKKQREVNLDMNINLDNLDLNTRQLIMLTPVLESEDQSVKQELPPVVINGRNRDKVNKRRQKLEGQSVYRTAPYTVVKRQKGQPQQITYNQNLPFESWMRKGKLVLRQEVAGCVNCGISESERQLLSPLLGDPYKPIYKTSYITPQVEEIKNRDEVRELRLNFKVNSIVLSPDQGNNRAELEKVDSIVRAINYDDDFTLVGVKITGYASPEGNEQGNVRLSEGRARALADYIAGAHRVSKDRFSLNWEGEDWKGLEYLIERSEMTEKEKEDVLDIIRNNTINATRKSKLQSYNGGRTYRWMLAELYPLLRRNNCVIDFTVRQFELEKARRMIRTNPKLMSLNEMYIVAESYPKGSAENQEAFDIAVRMYPDSPVAVNNAVAALIEKGDYKTAIQRLERVKDNPEVWTNLGVALAETGRYDEAMDYFRKAAANNSAEAVENVRQLEMLLEDL